MNIAWKSAGTFIAPVLLSIFASACQQDGGLSSTAPLTNQRLSAAAAQTNGALVDAGNVNGAAGQMPAYFNGQLFTINIKQQSDPASTSIIGQNPSHNEIFASNDLDQPQVFIPVINAIQGSGFNPLWRQIFIVFNAGFTPHQFVSAAEIQAAAAGANPEITLVETPEVYRCSVVGG